MHLAKYLPVLACLMSTTLAANDLASLKQPTYMASTANIAIMMDSNGGGYIFDLTGILKTSKDIDTKIQFANQVYLFATFQGIDPVTMAPIYQDVDIFNDWKAGAAYSKGYADGATAANNAYKQNIYILNPSTTLSGN